jgi:hypothetical protein
MRSVVGAVIVTPASLGTASTVTSLSAFRPAQSVAVHVSEAWPLHTAGSESLVKTPKVRVDDKVWEQESVAVHVWVVEVGQPFAAQPAQEEKQSPHLVDNAG